MAKKMQSSTREPVRPEIIWVTGASSGIGRSLCLQLASLGHQVIASARDLKALQQLAREHERIIPLEFDMTDKNKIISVREKIMEIGNHLDRVVLNAGCCEYLQFPDPDWCAIERVMAVNFQGSVNCLQLALPLLRNNTHQRPHIIGIVSQVIGAPFGQAEVYGASKAALNYFLESLRIDLLPENIDVTVIKPGFVDTPMTQKNRFDMPFLMTVDKASKLIVDRIFRRPRCYAFPRRLTALLKISVIAPAIWEKIMKPSV